MSAPTILKGITRATVLAALCGGTGLRRGGSPRPACEQQTSPLGIETVAHAWAGISSRIDAATCRPATRCWEDPHGGGHPGQHAGDDPHSDRQAGRGVRGRSTPRRPTGSRCSDATRTPSSWKQAAGIIDSLPPRRRSLNFARIPARPAHPPEKPVPEARRCDRAGFQAYYYAGEEVNQY